MTHRGSANQIILVILAGAALIAAPAVRFVLPERFLLDDTHLQLAMDPQTMRLTDSSFQGVAAVYTVLGLEHLAPIAGLANVALFVICTVLAVGWERVRGTKPLELAAVGACLVIGLAYLGQFSKELISLVTCALVLVGPRRRAWDVVLVLACIVYGVLLRPYWLLVGVLYVCWRLVLPRTRRLLLLLLLVVALFAALQPAFAIFLGGGLQSQREAVNTVRENPESVGSLITSPLPDAAGPMGVLAALLMVILLVVPIPLLASLSPFHMASGVVILVLWLAVLAPVLRGGLVERGAERPTRSRTVAARAASLLLALLLTQALFEPDYGSYLKHLAPLLPLALALLPASRRVLTPERSSHPLRTAIGPVHGDALSIDSIETPRRAEA